MYIHATILSSSFEVFLPPKKQQDQGEMPSEKMKADRFLANMADLCAHSENRRRMFVIFLREGVNENAQLDASQQRFVARRVNDVCVGEVGDSLDSKYAMEIASYINTCH